MFIYISNTHSHTHIHTHTSHTQLPLVNALQDKTAAVRSLAEQLLGSLMARGAVSKAVLEKATRDLPPATKRSLEPCIERLNSIAGTKRAGGGASTAATATATAGNVTIHNKFNFQIHFYLFVVMSYSYFINRTKQ